MNIQLIVNLYLNEETINGIKELENGIIDPETERDAYINCLIQERINMLKLQLYLNDINNMEIETIEKLIALEELQKGRRVSIINRLPLKETINRLKIILLTFYKQKLAVSMEINNYLLNLNNINCANYQLDKNEPILIWKYQSVYDIALNYIKDTLANITKLDVDITVKIALIEKELEIYVYTHKDDLKRLNQELDLLNQMAKTSDNKEILLNRINAIENQYKVFDKYGRNYIKDNEWNNLYKLKFYALTININELETSPFLSSSGKELSCYEAIIMDKINDILIGKKQQY